MQESKGPTVLAVPVDRLRPWKENPRSIRRDRLDNLKESIERDPDFMWRRPVLARADGTVYAGNQRLAACIELGWKEVPAIVEDVSDVVMRTRALRDNNSWGTWDDTSLLEVLKSVPKDATTTLGFEDDALAVILREAQQPSSQSGLQPGTAKSGIVRDEGDRRGYTTDEAKDIWRENTIRQIVLYFPSDQYAHVVQLLADVRRERKVDNNSEVLLGILEEYHADHCAGSESPTD